jgi:hypothetical protein
MLLLRDQAMIVARFPEVGARSKQEFCTAPGGSSNPADSILSRLHATADHKIKNPTLAIQAFVKSENHGFRLRDALGMGRLHALVVRACRRDGGQ